MKLSKAQKTLLTNLRENDSSCSPDYPPAVKLVKLGLAEVTTGRLFGCKRVRLTDEGKRVADEILKAT